VYAKVLQFLLMGMNASMRSSPSMICVQRRVGMALHLIPEGGQGDGAHPTKMVDPPSLAALPGVTIGE
jgi:hypothetical protein